jgi:hypothetical protein
MVLHRMGPSIARAPKRARWLRSLVREHRDSIPEGAGPAGQPLHPFTVGVLALRHPSNGTVVTVAPMDQSPHKSRLLAQLAKAHDAYHYMKDDKGGRVPTKADQEGLNRRRHAAQRAIGAFLEWAHAEGDIPSEHLILLVELVSCLEDLNRGRQPKLMKPAPREKRGNPGLPQGHAFKLGTACAAIHILSDKADSVENVEKEVARAIGMKVGALKSWRKGFNAGSKGPQARIAYENVLQICRQQDDPHEAVRRLLRKMRGH